MMNLFHLLNVLSLAFIASVAGEMSEEERLEEYHARGYEWPVKKFSPDTAGWRKIFERRLKQVERIQDDNEKYNGWVQSMSSGLVTQNFTENG